MTATTIGRIGLLASLLVAASSFAQGDSPISGRVSLGARSVDVDGALSKFREDVNLDDGVRIFDATLSYVPDPSDDNVVDRIELDAHNLGGDPFETIHFGARKYGAFDLKLDHRRSDYFYQDTILPRALASVDGVTAGDFHEFDFERVQDKASLGIDVTPATKLNFNVDRYSRKGDSRTTLDLQRDDFVLIRPIDESMNSFNVGVQHAFDKVTLIFEREGRQFDNANEMFLPGASSGENTTDPSELQFFTLDQSYDYRSHGNVIRVVARPTDRLDFQAGWRAERLALGVNAAEQSAGTDFSGNPFTTDLTGGPGAIDRDIDIQDFGFGYGVSERLRVVGRLRHLKLDQNGALLFGGEQGNGIWDLETTGAEAGVELAVTDRVVMNVGLSSESRDASYASALDTDMLGGRTETDRDGYFARFTFDTAEGIQIVASLEDNDINDPYTLASPTSSRRYRIIARRSWDNGYALSASIRRDERDNTLSGWSGQTDQLDLRLSHESDRLRYSIGLSQIDLSRNIDQTVTGGTRQDLFVVDYSADMTLLDGSVNWRINDRVSLGGSLNDYDNGGSFPINRQDVRAFVELSLREEYLVRVGYRGLDYEDDGFDDYNADMLEVAIGVKW